MSISFESRAQLHAVLAHCRLSDTADHYLLGTIQDISRGTNAGSQDCFLSGKFDKLHCAPVAQLVEHRTTVREVVSLTPARPTLRS